MYAII